MTQITTRRQLLDELEATRSCHLVEHAKSKTKRDALREQGVINIISYSLAAVNYHQLRSIVFGVHRFSGSRELRQELEARHKQAKHQQVWCGGRGLWALEQEHAGEVLACETVVRMMGGGGVKPSCAAEGG